MAICQLRCYQYYHKICDGKGSVDESSIIGIRSTNQTQSYTNNHTVWAEGRSQLVSTVELVTSYLMYL